MDLPERSSARLSRLHVIILLVMLGVAAMLAWTTWSARDLVRTFVPQIAAADKARLEVTEAHLWLEEIVSGDASEDPQQVWDRIDAARLRLDALREGGAGDLAAVRPVNDEKSVHDVLAADSVLDRFEQVARERVGGMDAGVGTDIDARFDDIFEEFVTATDQLDQSLRGVIERELTTFTLIQGVLIVVVVGLFSWVVYLLRRKEAMEHNAHLDSLRESYGHLEKSRGELERQNRLRGALVEIGDRLQGLDQVDLVARVALDTLCERTGAQAGACWRYRPGKGLFRLAGHALPEGRAGLTELAEGEGLVGRVVQDQSPLAIDIPSTYFEISSGIGRAPAPHLRILPLIHDGVVVAALELAFLEMPDDEATALLEAAAPAIAVRLHLTGRLEEGAAVPKAAALG